MDCNIQISGWLYQRVRFVPLAIYAMLLSFALLFGCKKTGPFPEAKEHNIDPDELLIAFNNAKLIDDLQGLAVARNGVIVAEEYYSQAGSGPDSILHVMSVTKSISSTLVGIAIDKGFIESVDKTVSDFLGAEVDTLNPELGKVTLHQLMTMTAGHDWHELGGESEFGAFVSAPDQLNYVLEKPIVNEPGTIFNYSDGAAHLVSVILSKACGMDASTFADNNLFGPMGIGDRAWYVDKRDFPYGGVGLRIGIHDMIKMGFLYLGEGNYKGQQIVSSEWISTATGTKINAGNAVPFLSDYGYFWWLGKAHGHDFICANGYGGQFILIVKDLDLVVASRTNYRGFDSSKAGQNWYNVLDIIINQIVPAVN